MQSLLYIIQKEFIQIVRNRVILFIMIIAPIVQLIVLTYAANNEVKNVELSIVDQDRSIYSRQLIEKIKQVDQFNLVNIPSSNKISDAQMQEGSTDIVLNIPAGFENDFIRKRSAKLLLQVNAINGQQAAVGASYLSNIIQSFNEEIRIDALPTASMIQNNAISNIEVKSSYWYNPELNYKYFMAPGIMGELVTLLTILLTAMNIVREKEVGTIEQINVTPIKKWQFILGKMIPFLFIGLMILTVGLTIGKLLFDVPMKGNLWVVFSYCVLNIAAVLGLGLFISNISGTQQQAMFTTFFIVIIFILMSGLFTPIESMPKIAQYFTIPNPVAHFVNIMRSVLLKGSSFSDVAYSFYVTAILAVIFNTMAVWSYRKVN